MDNPSAKTSHGEFPVEEIKINPSPNPKIIKPRDKKNKVLKLGLKFKGDLELQFLVGI
jgi:hypothetical protein